MRLITSRLLVYSDLNSEPIATLGTSVDFNGFVNWYHVTDNKTNVLDFRTHIDNSESPVVILNDGSILCVEIDRDPSSSLMSPNLTLSKYKPVITIEER